MLLNQKLRTIEGLVDAALNQIKKDREVSFILSKALQEEPINWADLTCADVEYVRALNCSNHFRVTIEEASPGGCPNLCIWIQLYLKDKGFENVEVVTEW